MVLFSTGGWWVVSSFGEMSGTVAIEMQKNTYIHAMDNGLFTLGAPHNGKESMEVLSPQLFSLLCC